MSAATVAMQDNPALLDPRGTLSPSQRALLSDVRDVGGFKVRNGWKVKGQFRKATTMQPLLRLDLVREEFTIGKHRIVATYTGRCVLDVLDERKGRRAS